MRERGWRLAYPGVSFEFGGFDDQADPFRRSIDRVALEGYDVSEPAVRSEDSDVPRGDGVRFGQDYLGGVTHTFTLRVRGSSREQAERIFAEAARAWRGDGVRGSADAYAELTVREAGIERTMLGRPRRFAPNYDRLAANEILATATFDTRDSTWLGEVKSARIDLRAFTIGGFTFPARFPLVMGPPTTRTGALDVGGTLPSPVDLELHGPIGNPAVRLSGGWTARLNTVLAAGRVVTISAGNRSVVDVGSGASYGGTVARGTRLDRLVLEPGLQQSLSLTGTDPSGSAYLVARWRDVYAGRG